MSGPQAVAKMIRNGGTRKPADTKRQFAYLSQRDTVPLQLPLSWGGPNERVTPDKFLDVAEEWARSTGRWQSGQRVDDTSPELTTHLVASFPPGTDRQLAERVAQNFARRLFDNPRMRSNFPEGAPEHRFPYILAAHNDKEHPHVHIVVCRASSEGGWLKIANRQGQRSDPNVLDTFTFADLRHELVDAAFEEGLDLEATTRLVRGLAPRDFSDPEYRRQEAAVREQWLRRAAEDGDSFVRVTDEGSGDGRETGEPVELDRGHTPEPEWDMEHPIAPQLGGRRAATPGLISPEQVAQLNEDPPLVDNDPEAPDQTALGDATERQEGLVSSSPRERVHAENAGPSRRRQRSEAFGNEGDDVGEQTGEAHLEGSRASKRARRNDPPNVLTRRQAAAKQAREEWEKAEKHAQGGVATRAQKRAADEAMEAWMAAERDAQDYRTNPSSNRRADEAAVSSKRPRLASAPEGTSAGEGGDGGAGTPFEDQQVRSARSDRRRGRQRGREA